MHVDYNKQAQVVFEAAQAAGIDLNRITKHREMASLQFGYSMINFGSGGIHARREGEGRMGNYPTKISYEDPEWVAKCVDILSSGRTVECGKGVNLNEITERIHFETVDFQLTYLSKAILVDDPWDLDPDYQRDHVWTERQREQFMGHLLENGRMPLVFLQDYQNHTPYEVVDGKQRITSCLMFVHGEIAAELSDGRRIWWKDFNEIDRRGSPNIKCGIVRLPDKAAVLRFYIKLNRGGTIHTDAEIDRVRALLASEEARGTT